VLRIVRRRRGWTQANLAAMADATQQTVSLFGRGKADGSTMRTIKKVAASWSESPSDTPTTREAANAGVNRPPTRPPGVSVGTRLACAGRFVASSDGSASRRGVVQSDKESEPSLVPSSSPAPPEIEVEAAVEALRAGTARLVDVRDEWEFRRRRVPGALLVPLGQLAQRAAELPRDKRLLIICEHGERSLVAGEFLRRMGFDDAASIRGGTSAWARGDRPVEQG